MYIIIALAIVIAIVLAGTSRSHRRNKAYALPAGSRGMLLQYVPFFAALDETQQAAFEERVRDFLSRTAITGVGVKVTDLDKLLVAAGAIIPIFAFPDWRYNNLNEVLVYPTTFNRDYKYEGDERNVLGMVGDGAMHRQMILSQQSIRQSFLNPEDGHNTVIHEFAHLIDKADGSVDGVPEYLLKRPYAITWLQHMRAAINDMRREGHSDINLYGATNEAEFFAVITEYLFERPHQLQEHHPELYAMLSQMFRGEQSS